MNPIKPIWRAGFTLIELIVVIAVIAVLAISVMPVANIILRRARAAQALTQVHALVVAVKGYHLEYNRLPNPNPAPVWEDAIVYTAPENQMVATLIGQNTTYNPHGVKFYDPPMAKNDAGGLISYGTEYGLVDPWSGAHGWQSYYIALDYNGDNNIANPLKGSGAFSTEYLANQPDTLATNVAVYSDGDPTVSANARRPVTSW